VAGAVVFVDGVACYRTVTGARVATIRGHAWAFEYKPRGHGGLWRATGCDRVFSGYSLGYCVRRAEEITPPGEPLEDW
jgi:hypothetical protein